MSHFATPEFWHHYRRLPTEVRGLADKNFALLRQDPHHPSLRLKKVASLLPRCGLVVARAGGSTLAELAVAGAPAIVCPYAAASDDHQRRNAAAFAGVHRVLEPSLPDLVRRLARELAELLTDGALRQKISQSLLCRARPDAAARVAEIVREFSGRILTGGGPLDRGKLDGRRCRWSTPSP